MTATAASLSSPLIRSTGMDCFHPVSLFLFLPGDQLRPPPTLINKKAAGEGYRTNVIISLPPVLSK